MDRFGGADEFVGVAEDLVEDGEGSLADMFAGDVDVEEVAHFELGVEVSFTMDDDKDKIFVVEYFVEGEPFAFNEIF